MDMAKTPINVLKNICIRKNWTVDYNMISEEGRVHEPTFTFRVYIEETPLSAIGTGLSKKKAKQAAAFEALKTLAEDDEEVAQELTGLEEAIPQEVEPEKSDKLNPVGKLQEICMKKKWSPPIYLTDEEDGPPHSKVFTMTCRLENVDLEASGHDKSKKGGKKIAAQEMLTLLETKGLYDPKSDMDKHAKSTAPVTKGDNHEMEKIVGFFRDINEKTNKQIDAILSIVNNDDEEDNNYVDALEKIANYIGCKVKYIDLRDGTSEAHHILIFMKPEGSDKYDLPIHSSWGSNIDFDKAKQQAAFTALVLIDKIRFL